MLRDNREQYYKLDLHGLFIRNSLFEIIAKKMIPYPERVRATQNDKKCLIRRGGGAINLVNWVLFENATTRLFQSKIAFLSIVTKFDTQVE